MSDYGDENFMEMMSPWSPTPSPTVRGMLELLEQTDDGLDPTNDVFLQTNQSKQRPGLVDRVSARVGRKIPPLRIENMTPFADLVRNPTTVPFVTEISPGISPSVLLQSPNDFSYPSSQPIPPFQFPNDWPPETVENAGDDHATTMIFNNNVPYQPMHFDLPPQEGSYVIPTENSAYIPSHVDPIGAPLVPSFDSEAVDDTDINKLTSLDDVSKSEDEDEEYIQDEVTNTDEDKDDESVDELEVKQKRKYEASSMMGDTRPSKDQSLTFCVETEEDHPCDGFRWRKYGKKIVKGNPNPRSYYKCTYDGCNVKKHVERGADDLKTLLVTYTGKHGHLKPATLRRSSSCPKKRARSSVPARLGRPLFSSLSADQDIRPFSYPPASAAQDQRPCPYSSALAPQDMRSDPYNSALAPQDMRSNLYPYASAAQDMRPFPNPYASAPQDMRHFSDPAASAPQDMRPFPSSLNQGVDMSGLSTMPSFPVNNQNHGFMEQNDEPWVNQNNGFMGQNDAPKTDQVIPDSSGIYREIMHHLFSNEGDKR